MVAGRYTLFTRIPLYQDMDGIFWTDHLWAKDLLLHLDYIPSFQICCPVLEKTRATTADTALPFSSDQVFGLLQDKGWGSVIRNILPNRRSVTDAVRASDIVHSSGAGWAFPLSYYILGLRRRFTFKWIMVIESTFWRAPDGRNPGLRKRITQIFHRRLIRACLSRADARIFTQDWYRQELYGGTDACHIAPAVWIDEDIVLPSPQRRQGEVLRVIWPARMIPEKGVETVLSALALYDGPPIQIDMVGAGKLEDEVRTFVESYNGPAQIRFLEAVAYMPDFFNLIRDYDACLIASLTEEQPRVAFDAFSQAVPCIASATHGNRSVITEGRTGHLFVPGDAQDLSDLLKDIASKNKNMDALRIYALDAARQVTHSGMHKARAMFLNDIFGG